MARTLSKRDHWRPAAELRLKKKRIGALDRAFDSIALKMGKKPVFKKGQRYYL